MSCPQIIIPVQYQVIKGRWFSNIIYHLFHFQQALHEWSLPDAWLIQIHTQIQKVSYTVLTFKRCLLKMTLSIEYNHKLIKLLNISSNFSYLLPQL